MRLYQIVVDGQKEKYIVDNLTSAVDLANNMEEQGLICEIHSFKEDTIIEREFWKRKK